MLLLGIDIGTGSTKGVLVDTTGLVLASEAISHTMDLPRLGWAEVDAENLWWREVCAISAALMARMPAGASLSGMCVSGVGPCLVLCDDVLRPLRPAILYGIDTRATAEIDSLTAELGEQSILDRAGTLLSTQAVGPKLEWVRRHEPEVFDSASGWYGSNSYIAAKLTGEYVMDHHTASQCAPLYAIREFDWNRQWAQGICGHLPLPRLVWPSDVVGSVTAAAAEATGVPVGTPVSAGTVDAYSEARSVGVRRPGDQMLMYGSTMFLGFCTRRGVSCTRPRAIRCTASPNPDSRSSETSRGRAKRPKGIRTIIGAAFASSPHTRCSISVSTTVGHTQFARIPCDPSSRGIPWSPSAVRPWRQ